MISEALRTTGWHIKTGAQAPHAIQVFGERSSGTNFVKRLIGRNSVLKPTEEMGWKHGFPQMTAMRCSRCPRMGLIDACQTFALPTCNASADFFAVHQGSLAYDC